MKQPKTGLGSSGIRDNHRRGSVGDFLRDKIKLGSHLSIVSAYFTIYAYEALRQHLDGIEHLRFLFGEPRFLQSLDPDKRDTKAFAIDADGLALQNRLQQKRIAKACADWIENKVDIRSIKQTNLLHGKMYHVGHDGTEDASRRAPQALHGAYAANQTQTPRTRRRAAPCHRQTTEAGRFPHRYCRQTGTVGPV